MTELGDKFKECVKQLADRGINVATVGPNFLVTAKPIGSPDYYEGTLSFDFRGISLYAFRTQTEIWQLVSDAILSYREAVPQKGRPYCVATAILIEEHDWQVIFILDNFESLVTLKDLLLKEWGIISRALTNVPDNSMVRKWPLIFVNISNNSRQWKYLVDDKTYDAAPVFNGAEFFFLFINSGRIFVASFALGKELRRIGLLDLALREFERCFDNKDKSKPKETILVTHEMVYCYVDMGKMSEAIQQLETLVANGLANALTYYNLGWSYANAKNYGRDLEGLNRAIKELWTAIEIEPDYYSAYYNLACYYSLSGKYDDALSVIAKAHQRGLLIAPELKDDPDAVQLIQDPRFKKFLA